MSTLPIHAALKEISSHPNSINYEVHLVFEMFYSKQREKLVYVDTVDTCCIE